MKAGKLGEESKCSKGGADGIHKLTCGYNRNVYVSSAWKFEEGLIALFSTFSLRASVHLHATFEVTHHARDAFEDLNEHFTKLSAIHSR